IASESLGYGATATWDGSSYWLAWETENHHVMGRNLAEDGTLGEISTWIGEGDCAGVTLTSDRQGQLLLSYVRYTNMGNARRVHSRLVGRGADTVPNGGTGGAGGGTSTNPGTSGTGASAGSSAAGASAGGTTTTQSTGTGANSTGGTTAASGGAAGSSSSSSGSTSRGGTTSRGGSTGTGGSSNPGFTCSVGNIGGGSTSTGAIAGLGLAVTLAAVRRRRRVV
ncbi:MAG TPA: hypothetical protein VFQ61_25580, partial [Polyangiaceae bacterium]|nr:hypothetical protein [Polyangiaceae bacterium]